MTAPQMTRQQALAVAADTHGDSVSIFCRGRVYWLGRRNERGDVVWVKGTSYRDVLEKAGGDPRTPEYGVGGER